MDMGFEIQLSEIFDNYGMSLDNIQFIMASATFPSKVLSIARKYIKKPIVIKLPKEENATNKNIEQIVKYIKTNDKNDELLNLLREFDFNNDKIIIFGNRKATCNDLSDLLYQNNLKSGVLHSDKAQATRQGILDKFFKGYLKILIATDVAARGLDLPHVKLVINYDMPENIDDYLHRIGRTGRIGEGGTAITFINESSLPSVLSELRSTLEE